MIFFDRIYTWDEDDRFNGMIVASAQLYSKYIVTI